MEFRNRVSYMYQSLEEAYRLGERYVQDRAMPGQAISLLEAAAQFAESGLVSSGSVQRAVEKSYGIRVSNARTGDERTKLLNLEQFIHERMINQTRAVGVVSNALRRARAGVRNQDRPIGTFLFLGPTGVGKTELSKALAAVYFGGEDRLLRLDLNEYSQPDDVTRLIADGAHDAHSLAAQISKQPFSVVLLDEIEKAHPNVLNTLLQLLDEGILRDINNRAVSFKDAIVIATSNAGADRIRQYIEAGWHMEQFEERFTNELIDSGQFKPEFLNRFDEIVVFRPLNQPELLQVLDLILASINKTLSLQKVSVHVADEAKQTLVVAGYDPRLGARPMRRVVQRTIEDIVAKRMLSGVVAAGSVVEITLGDVQAALGSNAPNSL
jgi:ATP-dependent Clp protease ATP-binding subunit ClpC